MTRFPSRSVIAEAIGEIRRHGYDVFLVLEATIGFNRREDEAGDRSSEVVVSDRKPAKVSARKAEVYCPRRELSKGSKDRLGGIKPLEELRVH